MFHFLDMEWSFAFKHFSHVLQCVQDKHDRIFLPHKTLLLTKMAALSFSMGDSKGGEAYCATVRAVAGVSALERDFAKIKQLNWLKESEPCVIVM